MRHIGLRWLVATVLGTTLVAAPAALILPAAAVSAGAEQIVIPIDETGVPWEFDDPCTDQAVHGLAHETGQVRVTDLSDQGFHVRLQVNGVADLLDDDTTSSGHGRIALS